MTSIREYDDLSVPERIRVLPKRHPYPMRALLYLTFTIENLPWEAVYKVAEAMGYVPVTGEEDLGGGMSRVNKGWTVPE